ncbi:MAG: hypothetical protein COU07_02660 [Candidatus Harrisonbacteria bacterium CG10_big_fil_rev_8_21_14_0_10_40_38]|uniref:Uncharacterized protein n=1 Tax=Candidatus Harrisonbacteria bacterium CG10_big_fil_rev_8_21_14_0_10_40_38 TaxID=1974583 RepID=A0A2H0UTY2_9BACT|nr:MAG: hypothetical protein COU07_02660 [Candidatus Harrisonbacteria bacterium CG10_big_fil_rev_8_21_14_0_10_40_38]
MRKKSQKNPKKIPKFGIFTPAGGLEFGISNKGIISLGITLLLGGIIIEIGVGIALITYLLNQNNFGIKQSNESYVAAESGIEDAILRVINDNFTTGSIVTIDLTNASADVRICEDTIGGSENGCGATAAPGKTEIISVGTSQLRKRKIVAVLNIDSETKKVSLESISETSF